jgi:hypothetical protein
VTGPVNAVSFAVPASNYADVVRLVVGGFASRLLGFEGIDDVQLALEAAVRSIPIEGTHVRISLSSDEEWLTLSVAGFEAGSVEGRLSRVVNDDIELGALLRRLVETVEIVGGPPESLVMRKRLAEAA